jgi:hypothetical protein
MGVRKTCPAIASRAARISEIVTPTPRLS